MTDLREPRSRVEVDLKDGLAPRQTLVERALAPIRRVTSRDLAPVRDHGVQLRGEAPFQIEPKRKFNPILWSAILVIVLPIFVTGVYLFFISSNQYVAETRLAVRQAGGSSGGGEKGVDAAAIISGAANMGGSDAEIVANYVHSPAIVADISSKLDVRAIFRRPEADFWARLSRNASAEDLSTYWDKMVSVYVEGTSGIVTISASAFRREDALALVQAILVSSEALVNRMSLKMRMDTISTAENEVRRAEGEVRFALADLTAFRNSEHLIDPVLASQSSAKLMMTVMADKIDTEGKLFVALRLQGPNAPGIASLRAKLESDNMQISQLKEEMAGSKQTSSNMASAISRFESLELKQTFASKMYSFARDGVERARIASIRQQIYLAVFVQPSLPEDHSYPLRWTDFILVSILAVMTWLSGVIVTASVVDHRL